MCSQQGSSFLGRVPQLVVARTIGGAFRGRSRGRLELDDRFREWPVIQGHRAADRAELRASRTAAVQQQCRKQNDEENCRLTWRVHAVSPVRGLRTVESTTVAWSPFAPRKGVLSRRGCEEIGTGTSLAAIFSGFGAVLARSQSHFFTLGAKDDTYSCADP